MLSDSERREAMNTINSDEGTGRPGGAKAIPVDLRGDLDATTRALCAADGGYVHVAMDRVGWDRRGVLQRLIRS
jgi:hypothetical protein